MRNLLTKLAVSCLLYAGMSFGVGLQTTNPDLKLSINGKGWVEAGQYVNYFNNGQVLDHTFISRTFMDLVLDAVYKERFKVSVGTEGRMWFNVPKVTGTGQATYVHRQNGSLIVSDANASYSVGDIASPFLTATVGLFPFKYNKQVRNLGEYLFRSGTYPAYLINNFDLPFARLTGAKVSTDFFGMWHSDVMYSMETTIPPFFDGSVSALTGLNFHNIFDAGIGVSFANLVSVDDRITTPHRTENTIIDTIANDTSYYTFKGTKLMGRLCFDPKELVRFLVPGSLGFFGNEDLRMYGEIAVLGLESYPKNATYNELDPSATQKFNTWGYDTLANKIAFMFGFNIPTCKVLDVLAVEFEHYGCPYPNSYKKRLGPGKDIAYPVPDIVTRTSVNYHADDWKWSVYAKRTFLNEHLGIVLQFARDHVRNETLVDESFDYEEALSLPGQWWWMAKIVSQF